MNKKIIQKFVAFGFVVVALLITMFKFESSRAQEVEVYLFINPDNVGDKNQILGINKELNNILSNKCVSKEINVSAQSQLNDVIIHIRNNINSSKLSVVITSGDYGINIINALPISANLITCHSSHQLTPNHEKIIDIAKIIALPKHSINDEFRRKIENSKTQLIETVGVSHNLSREELEVEAAKIKDLIPSNGKYIAVILGGDAPTPKGEMLYYTKDSAIKLGDFLSKKIKEEDLCLLILNGPRTGKHNPRTGEVNQEAHRNGNIDYVTKAFVEALESNGLKEGKSFILFDFQFGQSSYYKPVLGTILLNKGKILVPGESTSMISESIDNLPCAVTIYLHEAMNEVHRAHVESEYNCGRANILDQNMNFNRVQETSALQKGDSACKVIAAALSECINR